MIFPTYNYKDTAPTALLGFGEVGGFRHVGTNINLIPSFGIVFGAWT
jgi:hypothetical protein